MRRSKFILTAVAMCLIGMIAACTYLTGPASDATARILGRRIGLHGTQIDPNLFIGLGITADSACQQLPEGGTPADVAFTAIAKAIEEKTDDPYLTQDLKDVLQIMGLDLDAAFNVINLSPEIQDVLLQFVCSFAQGVERAKKDLKL